MTGRLARGAPAFYAFVALVMGLISAAMVGCGGSGGGGGQAKFSVGATFEAYTGRAIQGYVGSIKVSAQYATDSPVEFGVIKRGDPRVERDVLADKDYRFVVVGYASENGTGPEVARTEFVRRSPKRGQITDVTVETMTSDVASVHVDLPATIICGSTVDVNIEARNSSGNPILNCDDDSSFAIVVEPAGAGTVDWNNGVCEFTASADPSWDGQTVRVTATLNGRTGEDSAVLDCLISNLNLNLHWNADDRGLPGYANSARLTLSRPGSASHEVMVNRSSRNAYIEPVRFPDKIEDGGWDLSVTAYSGTDGGGTVVASGNFPVNVDPGEAPITINMDASDFEVTGVRVQILRGNSVVNVPNGGPVILFEGETVDMAAQAVNAQGEILLTNGEIELSCSGGNIDCIGKRVTANVRGDSSSMTFRIGDAPGPFTYPVSVVIGSPGVIIIWDPPTRDPAPGYAKSAQAEIFDGNGNPIPGFDPFCVNRPASGRTAAYWPDQLEPGTAYFVRVTLFPELDCAGPQLMFAETPVLLVPQDGRVSASEFDFPTVGDASNVEITVLRADGSVERYMDVSPPPVGRRNGPLFLASGEQVTISARATDANGTVTFFSVMNNSFDNDVCSLDLTNGRVTTNRLGLTFLTSTAQAGRGPEMVLETRVMQPGVVAFSDYDDLAFGMGAVKSYLYVPTARVNNPVTGDKIWEIPYRDDAYLGRPLAEPGVVLPTGQCNGYDVIQPAINSRANRIALTIAPFDTVSGDVTYYKDLVVMDVSYDANGAPVFGAIHLQNVQYDTADQFCPQWGPQQDNNLDGVLYFSSMEFNRDAGSYLPGNERDIFSRGDVDATPSPGINLTSGISGNLLWPAVAPDNGEMAVIRKLGFGNDAAGLFGVGQIVTIRTTDFAPTGEQIDVTASAASRIGYVASHGVQVPGSNDPATLINPDKYYIAFARSFDGGVTREVQLIRAERTQAALGAFIPQQQNASDPFCAAVDGADDFRVYNPRRIMAFLYNDTQIRAKPITSPATGGIGSLITVLDPDLSSTNIPSQPTFPAPFDVFDPLPR